MAAMLATYAANRSAVSRRWSVRFLHAPPNYMNICPNLV